MASLETLLEPAMDHSQLALLSSIILLVVWVGFRVPGVPPREE
jgi:hypothetical protein